MKIDNIKEPYLEFARGNHICPRAGITKYDVYDSKSSVRRDKIFVGAIGRRDTIDKLANWLMKCSKLIPAKADNQQPNLFTDFCGFNKYIGFKSDLIMEDEITRSLSNSELKKIQKITNWNDRVTKTVELYYEQIKFLTQNRTVDVVVCIIPNDIYKRICMEEPRVLEETLEQDESDDNLEMNFRRALKAKAMHLGKPLQLMRELSLESNPRSQQDDATKAWNFCTAVYYKANQTVPWKMITNINKPSVCYAGVGFYRSRDKKVLNTSLAQIFDELGNGVILRGTPVDIDKFDRRPHLTADQSYDLLSNALVEYRSALGNFPGRLVIHKSSNYNSSEIDGFRRAAENVRIGALDFVSILDSDFRLFREGIYPPYRGTHLEIDKGTHLLYTRGSVEYYRTYTGMYIPQPIEIRIAESDESPSIICQEIIGLTKMNWNNTQFDGKYPITIQCARRVGQIMKYLDPNERPQIRYSYYM